MGAPPCLQSCNLDVRIPRYVMWNEPHLESSGIGDSRSGAVECSVKPLASRQRKMCVATIVTFVTLTSRVTDRAIRVYEIWYPATVNDKLGSGTSCESVDFLIVSSVLIRASMF